MWWLRRTIGDRFLLDCDLSTRTRKSHGAVTSKKDFVVNVATLPGKIAAATSADMDGKAQHATRLAKTPGQHDELACCVCLEHLHTSFSSAWWAVSDAPLPCCGTPFSTTRCCRDCLRRIATSTGVCPVCRSPGLRWEFGRCRGPVTSDPIVSRYVTRPFFAILNVVVGILFAPLQAAIASAIEAAFSRGPT